MRKVCQIIAGAGLIAGLATPAWATSITFTTPTTATTSGGAVDASAMFTWDDNGNLTITLKDLQPNPKSIAQALSDLKFTLSDSTLTTGTISSSSATQITLDGSGHVTPGATGATGWQLFSLGSGQFHLDDLCGNGPPACAGPEDLIVGPPDSGGVYSNANPSITGNSHNPLLSQMAVFTLAIPGLTTNDTITKATFSFGTTSGIDEVLGLGPPTTREGPPPVPEPASLLLLGSGLIGAGVRRWRTRRTTA